MYALAINGSPRKGGNTETLLDHVLEPLKTEGWETERIQVGARKIRGCIACYKCFKNKDMRCAVDKDIFNDVMAQMVAADALILGSPTYFTDVSAELKALLDRSGLVALANERLFRGKIGAAVVAVRRGGATHVFDTINHMFMMSQMIVPGSTYWNMGMGLDKGEVRQDAEGLNNMLNLGETIAWLGKVMKPHLDTFPDTKATFE
jgi:multimeric flavodoxin WrbA